MQDLASRGIKLAKPGFPARRISKLSHCYNIWRVLVALSPVVNLQYLIRLCKSLDIPALIVPVGFLQSVLPMEERIYGKALLPIFSTRKLSMFVMYLILKYARHTR